MISEEIKSLAPAVLELCLSEVVSTVSQSVENALIKYDILEIS